MTARSADEILRERLSARVDPKLHATQAPAGYRLRGASTMNKIGPDGSITPVLQWVKTAKETEDAYALLKEFKALVSAERMPLAPVVPAPSVSMSELLAIYLMGDPHLGLMSWPEETGHDSTLASAEKNLVSAVDRLVGIAPESEQALLVSVGDTLHADNYENRTSRSGHALDVDTRWPKVLRVTVYTLIALVHRALAKHDKVLMWIVPGNHDDQSSIMLAICLAAHFASNPRVQINESPSQFRYMEFGKCLIGSTHGDKQKASELPGIMAVDQVEAWGRTQFRYWYCGHVHHETKKEYRGAIVETLRTLAARDAWHAGQGYRSGRSMVLDVLHRDRGRIRRDEVGVESL